MCRIIKVSILIMLSLSFLSCINNGQDGATTGVNSPDYTDPDPILTEELATTPKSPSSVFIAVNINGEIRGFYADSPADYTIIVSDACTEEGFEQFCLSDDKKYLLYVDNYKDLLLYDLQNSNVAASLHENLSYNEIQFINDDQIQYCDNGNIYCYTITTGLKYEMVDDPVLNCNHGAVVSPDGTKIVFKNQNPSQTNFASYAWTEVTGETVSSCHYLGDYIGDIDLSDYFEFVWVSDEHLLLKPDAGSNNYIKSYNFSESIPLLMNLSSDSSNVQYSEITISNDLSKLSIYGLFGLYQVDLTSLVFDSSIELNEIYTSEVVTTKFAAYSAGSNYLVAATSGCIGVYESGSLKQTDFDSTKIISEGETIYFLDCK